MYQVWCDEKQNQVCRRSIVERVIQVGKCHNNNNAFMWETLFALPSKYFKYK